MNMKNLFFILISLMLVGCGEHVPWTTYTESKKAVKFLEDQNLGGASAHYMNALNAAPLLSEAQLNLGVVNDLAQNPQQAHTIYQAVIQGAKNPMTLFIAHFNEAHLLGKEKKFDEALAHYQEALKINPTSQEVKRNIELLIQQQQQQQGGQGDNKDDQQSQDGKDGDQNKDGKDGKDGKDQKGKDGKDQDKKDGSGKDQDQKDQKDQDKQDQDGKDGKDQKEQENKNYKGNAKYKPRSFKGEELTEGDVNRILGEVKQQEKKIRSNYNKSDVKEQPLDKDW